MAGSHCDLLINYRSSTSAVSRDKGLLWVIVAVIPVLALIISIVAVKGFPLFQSIRKKIDRINLVLRKSLTGIRFIRVFNRENDEKKQFEEANKGQDKKSLAKHGFSLLHVFLLYEIFKSPGLLKKVCKEKYYLLPGIYLYYKRSLD
ncbi:MAG: hypothetical protein JXB88_05600 [Spirochaetales bacterium]|nr:hypothetical protein [Spirochaetales bacterium]